MNKIYKVVWSKVKNCYVVVSEIAKNIITGGVKSTKIGNAPMARGLALGAAMAFVITGNAMAAPFIDLQKDDSSAGIESWAPSGVIEIKLNDYELTVDSSGRGIAVGEWGYGVSGSEQSALIINSADSGLSNFGNVDVGTLNITVTGGHAIEAGSTTSIKADNIHIQTNGSSGLFLTGDAAGKTLDVDFDESLTITGTGSAVGIKSYGNGGTVSVNGAKGSTLSINTNGNAILAYNNSKTYVNTELKNNEVVYNGSDTTTIVGDIIANGNAEVNVGLKGSESSLTGTITTGENATTNLILNDNAQWNMTGDSTVTKLTGHGYDVNGEGYVLNLRDRIWTRGTIDVSGLNIESAGTGVATHGGGAGISTAKITADSIYIESGENAVTVDDGNARIEFDVADSFEIVSKGAGFATGISNSENEKVNAIAVTGTSELTATVDENAVWARSNAADISIEANSIKLKSLNANKDKSERGYAVLADGIGSSVTLNAKNGDIELTGVTGVVKAINSEISVVANGDISIEANVEGDKKGVSGVRAGTSAAGANGYGNVVLGGANTNAITIDGVMDYGIIARAANNTGNADVQSSVVVNGNSLIIGGDEDSDVWAGICAASGTEKGEEYNSSSVTVNTGYTEITATNALYNMSNGNVTVNGDLTINATKSAIVTRGYADTIVNEKADKNITVKIDGDIEFNKYYNNNYSVTDSNVVLNLANDKSYLEGNIIVTNGEDVVDANKATYEDITGMSLGISNYAYWATQTDDSVDNFVNNLTLSNHGTIKHNNSGNITVTNFKGSGDVVFDASSGDIHIDGGTGSLNLTMADKTADDLNTATQLTTVAEKLGVKEEAKTIDATVVMAEGDVKGETTGVVTYDTKVGEDGYFHGYVAEDAVTEKANTKNQSIGEAGVSLKLHWRSHMNDMNKRMGELRNANGEHGVWTRMVRGESEYENTVAQYNQYQLGYDEKLSVDKRWTVGAAVTFAEGDSNYGYGTTDDKSTAFAIYGTKLNNDGTFVDLIARYAHLESEYDDVNSGKGDYSTNGMSVSAEFGKRIQQGNGLWIEPQVELTYGTVDSAEFQLGGKTVQVGDMDSIIGRVGFSLGKDIKQGNVYARASYLYDFDGETENAFSNATDSRTIAEDLGGGWWEVGVGANINLSKATYIYADVEKTFGGEVDTNWQWNLGVRYSF